MPQFKTAKNYPEKLVFYCYSPPYVTVICSDNLRIKIVLTVTPMPAPRNTSPRIRYITHLALMKLGSTDDLEKQTIRLLR